MPEWQNDRQGETTKGPGSNKKSLHIFFGDTISPNKWKHTLKICASWRNFFYVLFIERTRFYNSVQCWAIIFDGWYFALHTLAYYCAGSLHIWLQPQHLSPTIQHQGQMKMKSIFCSTSYLVNQGKIWSYEKILSHKFKRTLQQSFATDLIEKRTSGTLIIVKSNIDRKKFSTNCWT